MKTVTVKKGENLSITEYAGMDYFSFNDLVLPFKHPKAGVIEKAVTELFVAEEQFDVVLIDENYIEDVNRLRGYAISGTRPKNIRRRK